MKRNQKTQYEPVSENIYQSGKIYRVRVTINGKRHSKNFNSKRLAVIYRNQLKNAA